MTLVGACVGDAFAVGGGDGILHIFGAMGELHDGVAAEAHLLHRGSSEVVGNARPAIRGKEQTRTIREPGRALIVEGT